MSENVKTIFAPLPGKIVEIKVKPDERVKTGDLLLILEAMKMYNRILSPYDGVIQKIEVSLDKVIDSNDPLVSICMN